MARPISNPPNPWHTTHTVWLGPPPDARLEVYEERARSALARNDSPDVPFRYGVNPYRGCQHACAYCYARPTHELIDLGAGTDFEKRIVVKTNVAEVLRAELARPRWTREWVTFSGVTDCYQPLEAHYGLTRSCLEACRDARTPVAVLTKSALVARDVDVLADLARGPGARVFFSIPFLDGDLARAVEPGAPTPAKRFEAMERLAGAGIPVGISLSPLIPGLNEDQVPGLLRRAREAGASRAFLTLLHLSRTVERVFAERLEEALPGRVRRVFRGLADLRGGATVETRFGERMRGSGPRWELIQSLFQRTCARLGLETDTGVEMGLDRAPAAPSAGPRQGLLFPEPEGA